MFETYKKGSPTPHQNTDTHQNVGKSKYVPKSAGGKDGEPGHPSGKTSYPSNNAQVTMSTDKHNAKRVKDYASGGGNKQVSATYPGKRAKFATEQPCSCGKFVPTDKNPTYGVGGA